MATVQMNQIEAEGHESQGQPRARQLSPSLVFLPLSPCLELSEAAEVSTFPSVKLRWVQCEEGTCSLGPRL